MTEDTILTPQKRAKKKLLAAGALLPGDLLFQAPLLVAVNESSEGDSWCD